MALIVVGETVRRNRVLDSAQARCRGKVLVRCTLDGREINVLVQGRVSACAPETERGCAARGATVGRSTLCCSVVEVRRKYGVQPPNPPPLINVKREKIIFEKESEKKKLAVVLLAGAGIL